MPTAGVSMELVKELVARVVADYEAATYDRVTLVYTQFRSIARIDHQLALMPL